MADALEKTFYIIKFYCTAFERNHTEKSYHKSEKKKTETLIKLHGCYSPTKWHPFIAWCIFMLEYNFHMSSIQWQMQLDAFASVVRVNEPRGNYF